MSIKPVDKRIIELIKSVPKGYVATYGSIARRAGENINPRRVGYVLRKYSGDDTKNWYRIINSAGKISVSKTTPLYTIQKQLLEKEGVVFSKTDKVDLNVFQYGF